MGTNDEDDAIVRSTIELAHSLGLLVVAEGVESEDILERLGALGCDLAQGYCLSMPVPAAELFRSPEAGPRSGATPKPRKRSTARSKSLVA
jgi:EAL domain-containing protein (putative c-di-GMP-specific phosphodiesterase class I)